MGSARGQLALERW